MKNLRSYYLLTKPGIIRGNLMTATAGFLLAAKGDIDLTLLLAMLAGTSLVIASACVSNNYIDREIDAKMERTKSRASVSGVIPLQFGVIYAALLGITGFGVLLRFTNVLTAVIGLIGFIDYVILYGLAKRRSPWGTIVGSVSGATPIVAGYVAYSNQFDLGALLLFAVLTCWQMPHFYSIAMYRLKDYKAAKLPVLPAVKGLEFTKRRIMAYIVAFIGAEALLTYTGYTGITYLVVILVAGAYWFRLGWRGFKVSDDVTWARKMFGFSLLALLVFSLMLALNNLLP